MNKRKTSLFTFNNFLKIFILAGIVLGSFLAEYAQADDVIRIVYPESGAIFAPGETITVIVEPAPEPSLEVVFVGFPKTLGYEASDTTAPYELELTLPDDVIGPIEIDAAAHGEDENDVFSDSVEIQLQPEGELSSLSVRPSVDVNMSFLTEERRLQVKGNFTDGTVAFINGPEFGTMYQTKSGTENIIAVNDNGVVTAQGNGEDSVMISNSGMSKEVKFKVNITNTLPVLNPIENQILEAGKVKEMIISGTDPDGNDLEYRFGRSPGYVTFVDRGDGTAAVTFYPQSGDVGTLSFLDISLGDNGDPGLMDYQSIFIKVFDTPIPPPTVIMNLSANALSGPVEPGEAVTVSWKVEYAASCEGREGLSGELKALGGGFVVVNPEETTAYSVECTGPGGTTSDSRTVEVEGAPVNQPPEITDGPEADDDEILENTTTEVSVAAFDPDGDTLDYDWSATGGSITGTGAVVTYLAPKVRRDTTYTVSVDITDGRGGSVSGSVDILVKNKTTGGGRP